MVSAGPGGVERARVSLKVIPDVSEVYDAVNDVCQYIERLAPKLTLDLDTRKAKTELAAFRAAAKANKIVVPIEVSNLSELANLFDGQTFKPNVDFSDLTDGLDDVASRLADLNDQSIHLDADTYDAVSGIDDFGVEMDRVARQARDDFDMAMQDIGADVFPDLTGLETAVADAVSSLRGMDPIEVPVKAKEDQKASKHTLDELRRKFAEKITVPIEAKAIGGDHIRPTVEIASAMANLGTLSRMLDRLSGRRVNVAVEWDRGAMRALMADLASIGSRFGKIPIEVAPHVDESAWGKARLEIESLSAWFKRVTVDIDPSVDHARWAAALAEIKAMASRLGKFGVDIDPQFDARAWAAARGNLAAWRHLFSDPINIPIRPMLTDRPWSHIVAESRRAAISAGKEWEKVHPVIEATIVSDAKMAKEAHDAGVKAREAMKAAFEESQIIDAEEVFNDFIPGLKAIGSRASASFREGFGSGGKGMGLARIFRGESREVSRIFKNIWAEYDAFLNRPAPRNNPFRSMADGAKAGFGFLHKAFEDAKSGVEKDSESAGGRAGAAFSRGMSRSFSALKDTWSNLFTQRFWMQTAIVGGVGAGGDLLTVSADVLKLGGALAMLPAAGGAAAGAIADVKLAVSGLGEALSTNDPEVLAEAMRRLEPSAREFVTAVKTIGPAWDQVRKNVQEETFKGVGAALTNMSSRILPDMNLGLTAQARGWNALGLSAMNAVAKMGDQKVFSTVLTNAGMGMNNFAPGLNALLHALGTLAAVGSKFFPEMGSWLTEMSKKFDAWVTNAAKVGDIERWIRGAWAAMKDLASIAGSIHGIFAGMTKAAEAARAATGQTGTALHGLAESFKTLSDGMNGERFQKAATSYFTGVNKGLGDMARIAGPAFKDALEAVALALGRIFAAAGPAVGAGLRNFFQFVAQLAPHVADLFEQLSPLVKQLFDSMGPYIAPMAAAIGGALDGVGKLAGGIIKVVTAFIGAGGGEIFMTIVKAVGDLAKAFGDILDAIAPLIGPLTTVFKIIWDFFVGDLLRSIVGVVQGVANFAQGIKKMFSGDILGGAKQVFDGLIGIVWNALLVIANFFKVGWIAKLLGPLKMILPFGSRIFMKFAQVVTDAFFKLVPAAGKALDSLIKTVFGFLWRLVKGAASIVGRVAGAIGGAFMRGASWAVKALGSLPGKVAGIIGRVVQGIRNGLGRVTNFFGEWGRKIADGIGGAFRWVGKQITDAFWTVVDFFKSIPGKVENALSELPDKLRALGGLVITGFVEGLKGAFNLDGITGFFQGLWDKWTSFWDVHSPSRKTASLGQNVAIGFSQGFKGSLDSNNIFALFKKLFDMLVGLLGGPGAQEAVKRFGAAISGIGNAVSGAFTGAVGAVQRALSAIASAITGGISAALRGLGSLVSTAFSAAFNGAVTAVKTILSGLGTFLTTVFTSFATIITTAGTAIWTAISTVFTAAVNIVKTIFGGLVTFIATVGTQIVTTITGWATKVFQVVSTFFRAAWNAVVAAMKGMFTTVVTVGAQILASITATVKAVFSTIRTWFTNAYNFIVGILRAIWNKIVAWGKAWLAAIYSAMVAIANTIRQWINTAYTWIVNGLRAIWNQIVAWGKAWFNAVKSAVENLLAFVQTLPDKIVQVLRDAPQKMWDLGVQIITGLINGIKSLLDFSFVTDEFERVWNNWTNFWHIHSPSRRMSSLGVYIVQGFINGLKGLADVDMVAPMADMLNGVKSFWGIHSPSTTMSDVSKQVGAGWKMGIDAYTPILIRDMQNFVRNYKRATEDQVSKEFRDLARYIGGEWHNAWAGSNSDVVGAVGGLVERLGSMSDAIFERTKAQVESYGEKITAVAEKIVEQNGKIKEAAAADAATAKKNAARIKDANAQLAIMRERLRITQAQNKENAKGSTSRNNSDAIQREKDSQSNILEQIRKEQKEIARLRSIRGKTAAEQVALNHRVESLNDSIAAQRKRIAQSDARIDKLRAQSKENAAKSAADRQRRIDQGNIAVKQQQLAIERQIERINDLKGKGANSAVAKETKKLADLQKQQKKLVADQKKAAEEGRQKEAALEWAKAYVDSIGQVADAISAQRDKVREQLEKATADLDAWKEKIKSQIESVQSSIRDSMNITANFSDDDTGKAVGSAFLDKLRETIAGSGPNSGVADIARQFEARLSNAMAGTSGESAQAVIEAMKGTLDTLGPQLGQSEATLIDRLRNIVTGAVDKTVGPGMAGVIDRARGQLDKVKDFSSTVKRLIGMGLNKTSLEQIVSAGPFSEMASVWKEANETQVAELNSMVSEMDKYSGIIGTDSAEALFGAGRDAAQALVDGLKSQEKALSDQLGRLEAMIVRIIETAGKVSVPDVVGQINYRSPSSNAPSQVGGGGVNSDGTITPIFATPVINVQIGNDSINSHIEEVTVETVTKAASAAAGRGGI